MRIKSYVCSGGGCDFESESRDAMEQHERDCTNLSCDESGHPEHERMIMVMEHHFYDPGRLVAVCGHCWREIEYLNILEKHEGNHALLELWDCLRKSQGPKPCVDGWDE